MKLDYQKMVRIVKRKQKGLSSKLIAKQFDISTRRVEQIWSYFQKNKTYLALKKQGRKSYRKYSDNIIEKIIRIRKKYRFGATYIAKYLRDKEGIKVGHTFIHNLLIKNNMATPNKNKQKNRKPWIRYERKHSLTAVHVDWHYNSKLNKWVYLVEDDASRKILAGDEFDNAYGIHSIRELDRAYQENKHLSPILQVISDHGTQFYPCKKDKNGKGETEFQKYCKKMGIKHILCRIKHPQSNGKLEKLNHTYELHRHEFNSFNEWVVWYNDRPHGSLDMKTPNQAFWDRMPTWFFAEFINKMEENNNAK